MTRLQEALQNGQFAVTGEIGPPKGVNMSHCMHEADCIKDRVVAINVTDNQSSVMHLGSIAVCSRLVQEGYEPIFQLTCRDRNRMALESDILSAYTMGVRNMLALTGDHNVAGDHPESMPVFDLDSVSLLQTISVLMGGKDLSGEELDGTPTDIFPGAVVAPGIDPLGAQLFKMEAKVAAGAKFFQTQAIYDPAVFEQFMIKASQFGVPVLAGIVIIKSAGMARFMNANVPGVFVPNHMIKALSETAQKERAAKSIELMAELIQELRPMCQGVHIMAMGWEQYVPGLLDACGL
jgi:methylenetetrahydrofolate reductase (NADPH)